MDARIISQEDALRGCAWCGKNVGKNSEVFGLSAELRQGVNLSRYEGKVIEVTVITKDKRVPMIVTTPDSDAKRDGKDVMFMLCSRECAVDMKKALQEEKFLGDVFWAIHSMSN